MKMHRILLALFITLALVALLVAPAMADGETTTIGVTLVALLTETVAPIIGALLAGLASLLLWKLQKKFGFEASEALNQTVRNAAFDGVAFAAEYAASKAKLDGRKLTGNDKLDIAIAHMLKAVPQLDRDQATAAVHAVLPKLKGEGATGESTI